MVMKREVEIVVLSDIHLGTYGCHAAEVLNYLKSVSPKHLILNGDIIDIWQFKKKYWPKEHMQLVQYVLGLITAGVKVTYITGNHDEMLRRFEGLTLGNFTIENKLVLDLPDGKAWIFHGDVFDVTMQYSKWLSRLGAHGYDLLILLNRFINKVLESMGKDKMSLSKRVKNSVKGAVKFINQFEFTAAEIAIENNYQYVICGHIHQPEMRTITTKKGEVKYLNSGDWVEHLTALEFNGKSWRIFDYEKEYVEVLGDQDNPRYLSNSDIFSKLLEDFNQIVN